MSHATAEIKTTSIDHTPILDTATPCTANETYHPTLYNLPNPTGNKESPDQSTQGIASNIIDPPPTTYLLYITTSPPFI